jgi:WD40 repeat protein/transcriptional regulator with XRE-family HTH domain
MHKTPEPESFRGLLLRNRGRTRLTQRNLAARVSVSLRSIQDWEAGLSFPSATRLQALIHALLEAGGLTSGQEELEARELWTAVEHAAARMHMPLDEQWLAEVLSAHARVVEPLTDTHGPASGPVGSTAKRVTDWGEAPDTTAFVGRAEELTLLRGWVLEERCRLVAILGFGGIGKTTLAARLAQEVVASFERVYWRSLRNAPPLSEWLAGAISFLSDQELVPPPSESERITELLQLLRSRRCLLVLENSEALFEPGQREGHYRAGMDGYGRLLLAVGESSHQSCLVLTSREAPPELAVLGGAKRDLEVHGLGAAEAQSLLADKHLTGDSLAWANLVNRYGGNGLALKIVGETIRQLYDGDIAAFLADVIAGTGTVFGGIRRLLDVQAERLSLIEYELLTRLAIEREPLSLAELSQDVVPSVPRSSLIEAIETLRRRSLVERGERGGTFTLQSMVIEYMTDRLVETAADELGRGQAVVLVEQPLIRAQAKDYVRQSQERLIGRPILQRLDGPQGEAGTERLLLRLLDGWRNMSEEKQGFGPGNVVNLLRLLRGDLHGVDLSRLVLRQVFLQGVDAQGASLANAQLDQAVLDEAFAYPTAVALSADGALLAAGTPSGEVRLWRAVDRTLLVTTRLHSNIVWNVALSGDGQLVASCGDDGKVQLWKAETGQLLATLLGHSGGVRSVALSADGQLVASGGWDGTVRLWTAPSGRLLTVLEGHTGAVRCVALSADGRRVASGGADGAVRLWETASGRLMAADQTESGILTGVALSSEGALLAGGGVEGWLRLWDGRSGHLLATLQHTTGVRCVALSGDGRLAVSGSTDGTVRLWETRSGQLVANAQGHTGMVWGVALSADGRLLASGGVEGTVRLWEASTGQPLATLQGDAASIQAVAVSADGRRVATAGADATVRLWDAATGQLLTTFLGHNGTVYGVALSRSGRILASAGWDGTARLWDVATGRPLATLEGHTRGLSCVALSPEGQLLASSGDDGIVRLWGTEYGQPLATLAGHSGPVRSTAFSGDGTRIASSGADGTVRVWETSSGRLLNVLQAHVDAAWCVVLSEDGRLAVSCGVDGMVRLWGTDSGRLEAALPGHAGAVYGVALSRDCRRITSCGVDGTVRLWDVGDGKCLATLTGHTGVVWSVALSGEGQLVASGGDDGIVRLWGASSGAAQRTLRSDRHYERLDITGLTGVTEAQRAALVALGAVEH